MAVLLGQRTFIQIVLGSNLRASFPGVDMTFVFPEHTEHITTFIFNKLDCCEI